MIASIQTSEVPCCPTHNAPSAYCFSCVRDAIAETRVLEEAKSSTRNYLSGQVGLCVGFVAGFVLALVAFGWP